MPIIQNSLVMTLEKLTANEKNANGMFLMTKSIIIVLWSQLLKYSLLLDSQFIIYIYK